MALFSGMGLISSHVRNPLKVFFWIREYKSINHSFSTKMIYFVLCIPVSWVPTTVLWADLWLADRERPSASLHCANRSLNTSCTIAWYRSFHLTYAVLTRPVTFSSIMPITVTLTAPQSKAVKVPPSPWEADSQILSSSPDRRVQFLNSHLPP